MKLIKVAGFIFQFGLIGLALAVLYLFAATDKSKDEILAFLSGNDSYLQSTSTGGSRGPVFSYADAVASSASSVVTIYTSKTVKEKPHPLLDDPVFSQFFGDQLERRQRSRSETNLGSGVMIGSDGYILTNQHVIDGADEILISLADGRGSQAVLIGEDRETDIAILQIPMSGLTGIKIADSKPLRVGDVVLAIGNPLNVGQTVTMGIVSATGRNRIGLNTFENFIQTDAAINPGNSGGPLLDSSGRLIGVNTAIASPSGAYAGVGFAIPVDTVSWVVPDLIEFGTVQRPGFGLTVWSPSVNRRFGFRGAMVQTVERNGPAASAGLRPTYRNESGRIVFGDVITAIDGEPVDTPGDLLLLLEQREIGAEVEVTYVREQRAYTVRIRLVASTE